MSWIGSSRIPLSEIGMTEAKYSLLDELAGESGYWMRARAFVKVSANRKLSSLSDSQRKWLTTIIIDLGGELYKRSWQY